MREEQSIDHFYVIVFLKNKDILSCNMVYMETLSQIIIILHVDKCFHGYKTFYTVIYKYYFRVHNNSDSANTDMMILKLPSLATSSQVKGTTKL